MLTVACLATFSFLPLQLGIYRVVYIMFVHIFLRCFPANKPPWYENSMLIHSSCLLSFPSSGNAWFRCLKAMATALTPPIWTQPQTKGLSHKQNVTWERCPPLLPMCPWTCATWRRLMRMKSRTSMKIEAPRNFLYQKAESVLYKAILP